MTNLRASLSLLVLVLTSCAPAAATADDQAPSSDAADSSLSADLRLHFRKPRTWTNTASPRVHYWQVMPPGPADTTWPGVALTPEGNGWFGVTIQRAASAHLIFNNNPSPQTADLFRAGEGWYDDGTWYDSNPDVRPDGGSVRLVLHFKPPDTWANVPRVHYWNVKPSSVSGTPWPGRLMTAEADGWFTYTIVGANSAQFVFNNDSSPQTPDLSRAGDGWYEDGVWSSTKPTPFDPDAGTGYQVRDNKTILQAFDWYVRDPTSENGTWTQQPEPESNLWEYVAEVKAEEFYGNYFTHVWLPPTGKAFSPVATEYNTGYAVYDHYDLGEFNQMSHTRTRYGTKAQLHQAVTALHSRKMKVIADIVMNHMLGTDNFETMPFSVAYDTTSTLRTTNGTVTAYLDFDFANAIDPSPRGTTYSSFRWVSDHFTGMENYGTYYLFPNKSLGLVNNYKDLTWADGRFSSEYQFLRSDIILGADLDLANPAVAQEMVTWTKWLTNTVDFDGFRIDAVRHMDARFVASWANQVKAHMNAIGKGGPDMLMFGENWDGWGQRLNAYLHGSTTSRNHEFDVSRVNYNGIERSMSLFDVPLHYAFQKVSGENVDSMDIKDLPGSGLLALSPDDAVTFVDNHDTIPDQPLGSYINIHNKLQAYAYILLNEKGTPCVFYRDLYKGNFTSPYTNDGFDYLHTGISQLLEARAKYAYGPGSYYGAPGLLGYKRSGDGRGHSGARSSGVIYLIKQFDRWGQPTTGSTTLTIPSDGRNWRLFSGSGTRNGDTFTLSGGARYAVWVPGT
jgi:alpha-amylase